MTDVKIKNIHLTEKYDDGQLGNLAELFIVLMEHREVTRQDRAKLLAIWSAFVDYKGMVSGVEEVSKKLPANRIVNNLLGEFTYGLDMAWRDMCREFIGVLEGHDEFIERKKEEMH